MGLLSVGLASCTDQVADDEPAVVGMELGEAEQGLANGGLVSNRWAGGIVDIGFWDGSQWIMSGCSGQVVSRDAIVLAAHCIRRWLTPNASSPDSGTTWFAAYRMNEDGTLTCITDPAGGCQLQAEWAVPSTYAGVYHTSSQTWTGDNADRDVATLDFNTNFANITQKDAAYLNSGGDATVGAAYGYADSPASDGKLRGGNFSGITLSGGAYTKTVPQADPHLCAGDSGGPLRFLTSAATTPENTVRSGVLSGVNSKGGCSGANVGNIWAPINSNRTFIESNIGRACTTVVQNGWSTRDCW
jgi:hypothetical protein